MTARRRWLVAGLGLALLALLFARWWGIDWPAPPPKHIAPNGDESIQGFSWIGGLDAWTTTALTSVVVCAFALVCLLQAPLIRGPRPAVVRWALAGASLAVVGWIAARMIWPPSPLLVPAWGAWASLGVAVAVLIVNGMDSIARR